jgi:uncharacterized protein YbjQ (UPF0145 family)
MFISGMSGNEIYCLALKGFSPGEIVVGNSVCSLGIAGSLRSIGNTIAGGEISTVTDLTGVVAELKSLAGYTEFLSQGTAVHATAAKYPFFSSATSGIELYCHLDAGYRPIRFAMGNIAYALGIGRGLSGAFRTLARGEVHDFSAMYNEIRHTALARLRAEAARLGSNAVVDILVKIIPTGAGAVEFLLTGTASHHPRLPGAPSSPDQVATSELTGEELWNLARMGYAPQQLVMATSVYSLGLAGGIGALFKAIQRGEIPEVTHLIYEARENCLDLVRREAQAIGAERVIGNRLTILELAPGLIEIFAVGTAIRRLEGIAPETETLIPQAVIVDRDTLEGPNPFQALQPPAGPGGARRPAPAAQVSPAGCLVGIVVALLVLTFLILGIVVAALKHA